jgi:low affinity Fe/Cu permease
VSTNGKTKSWFNHFARTSAKVTGHPIAFFVAVGIIIVWALTGPIFQFNDTWQLVINTSTTIVTFLMVFLIQNAQNRDSLALQLKMDEVIRAVQGAHNTLMNLEELDDEELEEFHKKYAALAERARQKLERGIKDDGCPELDEAEDKVDEAKDEVEAEADRVNEQFKEEVEEVAAKVKKKSRAAKPRTKPTRKSA